VHFDFNHQSIVPIKALAVNKNAISCISSEHSYLLTMKELRNFSHFLNIDMIWLRSLDINHMLH